MSSDLEATFATWLRRLAPELPPPVAEYRFAPPRRWRFDAAWPGRLIAVELEGGVFTGGRHTRGTGYEADCEKYNAASCEGWALLRFTAGMLERDPAACVAQVVEIYEQRATAQQQPAQTPSRARRGKS